MLGDRAIASITVECRVEDHDTIEINGKRYSLNEEAAWITRPRNVASLWVSEEAAKVMEWAVTILADDPDDERNVRLPRRLRLAGEFSPAEAMEHFSPEHEHGSKRDWWEPIKTELRHANLLDESGYFAYKPTSVGWSTFNTEPRPAIRRLF